jgi:hypothetical protein
MRLRLVVFTSAWPLSSGFVVAGLPLALKGTA